MGASGRRIEGQRNLSASGCRYARVSLGYRDDDIRGDLAMITFMKMMRN